MFELWVECDKLIGNLSLSSSIAAFLHLSFVFDLKYPKVWFGHILTKLVNYFTCLVLQGAQTLADILQRKLAVYGNDSG